LERFLLYNNFLAGITVCLKQIQSFKKKREREREREREKDLYKAIKVREKFEGGELRWRESFEGCYYE